MQTLETSSGCFSCKQFEAALGVSNSPYSEYPNESMEAIHQYRPEKGSGRDGVVFQVCSRSAHDRFAHRNCAGVF